MTLKEIIDGLRAADPDYVAPVGLGEPHSYRGYYEDLAFEPKENVTVREMLATAEICLGQTFEGYKGGDFTMREDTTCWIATYGCSGGDCIGPVLLGYLTGGSEKLKTTR